jgi:putative DNA primase/helicase
MATFEITQYEADCIRNLDNRQDLSLKSLDTYEIFSTSRKRELLRPITDRARPDRCAYKNKKGETGWTNDPKLPLDENRINSHLNGFTGCGIGFIKPGESTTRLALFDLDAHNGETPFSVMLETADRLCAGLEAVGLRPMPFMSSGGSGIHLWMIWNTPQDAHSVRQTLIAVLEDAGLTPGDAGVISGEVEIFPKQAALNPEGPGSNGNMAVIPFWNKSAALTDEFGLGLAIATTESAHCVAWRESDHVPFVVNTTPARPVGEAAAAPDDIGKIRRALAAVAPLADKLSHKSSATDYDTWRNIVYATHEASAGHEDGYDLVKGWSDLNPTNAGRRSLRETWVGCGLGTVTRAFLYARAHECDQQWDAPTADGFEDEPTEPHDSIATDNTARRLAQQLAGDGLADMTDAGNVNALASVTKGDLRYAHERGTWLHWTGNRWQEDPAATQPTQAALQVAAGHKDKAKQMDLKAAEATTTAEAKQFKKLADTYKTFANYCRSRRGIDAMLALATRDPRFVIFQAALDCDIYLLGVQNGVVDLRTGQLRETARDDFITKQSPYVYRPNATAPRFLQFGAEIACRPIDDGGALGLIQYRPRPDLVRYTQKALGYMLTGSTLEHKMFIASGGGSNGKSILFDLVIHIMGDYAGSIPCESLMTSARGGDAERPTPFARSVAGKRLIVTSEAKEGQKLDVALVKRQTGDATLTARGCSENAVTFTTTHKLVLLTNHAPELDHADDAIRGRLHSWPFERTWNRPGVPNRNPRLEDGDKNLMEKLKSEGEGVLAWLVQGSVSYLRDGLEPPPEVVEMTNTYLAEQDSFGRWLSEMDTCEPKHGLGASVLFELFRSWCINNGAALSPSTSTAFGKTASSRDVPKTRNATSVVYGLRPLPVPVPDPDLF